MARLAALRVRLSAPALFARSWLFSLGAGGPALEGMVRSSAFRRRGAMPAGLRACGRLVALLWVLALSAPLSAHAEAEIFTPPAEHFTEPELMSELPVCPSNPIPGIEEEEAGEIPPETRELSHLRLEAQEVCSAQTDRLDQVIKRLWWVTVEQAEAVRLLPSLESANPIPSLEALSETLVELKGSVNQFSTDGDLRASILGSEDGRPLPISGDIETTPGTDEGVRQAVLDSAETSNQNVWGLAGFFVGLIALAVAYKLVRP